MARALLQETLGWELEDHVRDHITSALGLMTRVVKNPPRKSGHQPMTAELGAEARRLHRSTSLTNAEIGRKLNVDGGRVSEALNGMW